MEDLEAQSSSEGCWATLSNQVEQALYVVEEAVSLSDTDKDLKQELEHSAVDGIIQHMPRIMSTYRLTGGSRLSQPTPGLESPSTSGSELRHTLTEID